ncbi:hypothetical protein BKA67DRAFT_360893 [Truncatella angustata]|uniref:Uncharacterized protein n=1 Tax=Truncatella angustata TaxID=152316 RepID=A0A9P8ZUK6_9PEZI|nr:uncharacterized protein BKA67DRAFT_360893 [Truncatella angustata]KAH6648338.1 hypothetical protein BKA67DRAFT_360893 [Truncatella angustata]
MESTTGVPREEVLANIAPEENQQSHDTYSKEISIRSATTWDWKEDKHNPYNWSKQRKNIQLVTMMSIAFTWYVRQHPDIPSVSFPSLYYPEVRVVLHKQVIILCSYSCLLSHEHVTLQFLMGSIRIVVASELSSIILVSLGSILLTWAQLFRYINYQSSTSAVDARVFRFEHRGILTLITLRICSWARPDLRRSALGSCWQTSCIHHSRLTWWTLRSWLWSDP